MFPSSIADYVLATGKSHKLSDFLEIAFEYFNLDYRNYIKIKKKYFRPTDRVKLCGDSSKARGELNWKLSLNFRDIVHTMCEAVSKP